MNDKGFTLIESLLVLAILTLITFISTQIIVKQNEEKEIHHFFEQLKLDILTIESYSIENNYANIILSPSMNKYQASNQLGKVLFERKIPESLKMNIDSNLKSIQFTSGKIRNFGKMIFNYEGKNIEFIVYIERGRTRIVER